MVVYAFNTQNNAIGFKFYHFRMIGNNYVPKNRDFSLFFRGKILIFQTPSLIANFDPYRGKRSLCYCYKQKAKTKP